MIDVDEINDRIEIDKRKVDVVLEDVVSTIREHIEEDEETIEKKVWEKIRANKSHLACIIKPTDSSKQELFDEHGEDKIYMELEKQVRINTTPHKDIRSAIKAMLHLRKSIPDPPCKLTVRIIIACAAIKQELRNYLVHTLRNIGNSLLQTNSTAFEF